MAGNMFCKGNGIAVGLTNGTNNYALAGTRVGNASDSVLSPTTIYGAKVGTTITNIGPWNPNLKTVGITTDPTKSGIVVDIDSLIIPCSMIIKY